MRKVPGTDVVVLEAKGLHENVRTAHVRLLSLEVSVLTFRVPRDVCFLSYDMSNNGPQSPQLLGYL